MIFLGKNRKEKGNEKIIHKRDEWNLRKCSEKFIQGGYYNLYVLWYHVKNHDIYKKVERKLENSCINNKE
jgi:hypothetical protein